MQPNILWIVIDSLRYDHVGLHKGSKSLTPNLDRFTRQSIVFDQAISQGPSTPPSVKSFMSSTYPNEYDGPTSRITPLRPYLPTFLNQQGYATAGITTNEYLSSERGWERDFLLYDDCNLDKVYKQLLLFRGLNQVTKRLGYPLGWPAKLGDQVIFQKASTWTEAARRPFFLWLQIMDVHWPYRFQKFTLNPAWQFENQIERKKITPQLTSETPKFTPEEHQKLLREYQDAVQRVDALVGDFLESLGNQGQLDNTVVIISADHGEEFFDHGHYFHSSNLYDVLVHVPLMISMPKDLKPANRMYPSQVRLIDIFPTLIDLSGGSMPDHVRGKSLLPILRGEEEAERPAVIESFSRVDFALRWQGWKYMLNKETGQEKLYCYRQDPSEVRMVLDEYPETVKEMRAQIEQHIQDLRIFESTDQEDVPDSPEMMARLRDLGYVA